MTGNGVSPLALTNAIEEAEQLAAEGDPDGAESVLEAASTLVTGEQDTSLLVRYAETCHRWGTSASEEAALRSALSREFSRDRRLEVLERLLDLLQQRLTSLTGDARNEVVEECETLGTEAIEALGQSSGLEWSNLVHARGLRRLDLARVGRLEKIADARADLEAHRVWLIRNESVPAHLQRANMIAFVDVELAELLLLEGRREEAAKRAEEAIAALESAGVPKWMVDEAYSVWEQATA